MRKVRISMKMTDPARMVLAVLADRPEDGWARQIGRVTGLGESTVVYVLARLAHEGYTTSRLEEPGEVPGRRGGKPRRFWSLTRTGRELASRERMRPTLGEMLASFHAMAGHELPDRPDFWIRGKGLGNISSRNLMLTEELDELNDGYLEGDLVKVADALADCIYVLAGTALAHGIPIDAVLAEVHRSNMTKTAGTRQDGKLMKGPGYEPPDIAGVLKRAGAA